MERNIDFYLSHGYDLAAAEYFSSGPQKIIAVEPNEDYSLTLTFESGEVRLYDVQPLIVPNTVFAFLNDPKNFQRVYLDSDGCVAWDINPNVDSNLVWNNKVDLSPDSCYMESQPLKRGTRLA